ncbi:TetR/AcrR family transcriptional regulator [Rhodococcus sp. G-MC3]|uniref:TetR/AcrR family transcriptional regulator n=1 Tax=Rhodococcus sp. G-MC3 TaxID=3046209 RepID=UPI0024B9D1FF|nr:TetR/AcrR family transcriptional regulator [Rhodococcus sp. G-MC3]MDJ0394850.1 TetR/AcrR family transcriptional regulator [Rhodococcus sp. G-MC3]
MARPKQQAARRREMVLAASAAICERGLTGLRIKDVAERAGLSAGLVSYYYSDLDDLVREVHESAVDRFHRARHDAVRDIVDPVQRLRRTVYLGIPESSDDQLCQVLYELHLHAARSPAHSVLMRTLFELEVSLYVCVIEQGVDAGEFDGRGRVQSIATTTVLLEDAYGLHLVGRNEAVSPTSARNGVLDYLAGALSCPMSAFVD